MNLVAVQEDLLTVFRILLRYRESGNVPRLCSS
jgi:hypothetical protein